MLIAHAAAGYIVAKWFISFKPVHMRNRYWETVGVIGGLLPDIDMFYFYWVDQGKVHHHRYITHWPVFWLLCLSISWLCWQRNKQNAWAATILLLGINGCIHLLLDTIVGDIWWLMPWLDKPFSLFTVPALYQSWYWNFILHWSFAFELLIWGMAIYYGFFHHENNQ